MSRFLDRILTIFDLPRSVCINIAKGNCIVIESELLRLNYIQRSVNLVHIYTFYTIQIIYIYLRHFSIKIAAW